MAKEQREGSTQIRSFWLRDDLVERTDRAATALNIKARTDVIRLALQYLTTATAQGPEAANKFLEAVWTLAATKRGKASE